jgi:chromate transporter
MQDAKEIAQPSYSLSKLAWYFVQLGTVGFGGPVALVDYMHRDLVEKRQWIGEEDYREGLALAQLAPGPLAAQLAIYIGFVHYRILGATIVGIAFVLPSFIMVLLLGYAYVQAGGLPWMQALFYGIGAAVIGIIVVSTSKLVKKTISSDKLLLAIGFAVSVLTFITEKENLGVILVAGIAVWFYRAPPKWRFKRLYFVPFLLQAGIVAADNNRLTKIAWFFLKAGSFVFGSGLAIVPFLYGGVVKEYHWLSEQQFLDAVAVAMITPGPVVITVGFIGYLVAGIPGACIAAGATFLPCYLFTVIPAPYFKKYGRRKSIKAFVDGVTAAAIGAIGGAVLVLMTRQLKDYVSVIIACITLLVLSKWKKIPEPLIIAVAAVIGLMLKGQLFNSILK